MYEITSPKETETTDAGVPKSPMASGITYGICMKKNIGVRRTAKVSFGENLKYKRNIRINITSAMSAHSIAREYRCPRINAAEINTIKLAGRIAHKSEAIMTMAIFVSASIYPSLLLITMIDTSARRNFQTYVM